MILKIPLWFSKDYTTELHKTVYRKKKNNKLFVLISYLDDLISDIVEVLHSIKVASTGNDHTPPGLKGRKNSFYFCHDNTSLVLRYQRSVQDSIHIADIQEIVQPRTEPSKYRIT